MSKKSVYYNGGTKKRNPKLMKNNVINQSNHGSGNLINNYGNLFIINLPQPTPEEKQPPQKKDVEFIDVVRYIFNKRKIIKLILTSLLSLSHLNAPSTVNNIPIRHITPTITTQKKIEL